MELCNSETKNSGTKNRNFSVASFIVLSCIVLRSQFLFAAITLPIEVLGPDGWTESVTYTVPTGQGSGVDGLWMQVNNLSYPNPVFPYAKASVQINNGSWIPLTNSTVQVADPGKSYGGIGGAFNTLKLTLPITLGTIHDGDNSINFRFNLTDGVSAGYRVLKLNFTSGATAVLPVNGFVNDDPTLWIAPSPADPVHGQQLWTSAALTSSPANQYVKTHSLGVHCMDCHMHDGRDLKYFNYSNKSIEARAQFHGLSAQDGADLAAYIRTLASAASKIGRPWNPPYQPGPGLDAQPLYEWAAGAGIDNVLDKDIDVLNDVFPSGINAAIADPSADINVRQTRVSLQFMDWNHWLPRTHPSDAWGASSFAPYLQNYAQLRTDLTNGNLSGFISDWGSFYGSAPNGLLYGFINPKKDGTGHPWSPTYSENVYDIALWNMVKNNFELFNEFNLQTQAFNMQVENIPANLAEPRGLPTSQAFDASPNILNVPPDSNGINGSAVVSQYLSTTWYYIQLVLNSNRWNFGGQRPQDWPYVYNKWKDLYSETQYPEGVRWALFLMKAGQITDSGQGPDVVSVGWSPGHAYLIGWMVRTDSGFPGLVADLLGNQWRSLAQAMLQGWFTKTSSYAYDQYTTQGLVRSRLPTGEMIQGNSEEVFEDMVWFMIPGFRGVGVSETLLDQIIVWAQGMWPNGAWDLVRTGVVAPTIILNNAITPGPFQSGAKASLFATANNFASPPAMELYANNVKVSDGVMRSDGHTYDFTWTPSTAGTYMVDARANLGGKFVSNRPDPYAVTVNGLSQNLSLNFGNVLPVNAVLGVTYNPGTGDSNVQYVWTITPGGANSSAAPATGMMQAGSNLAPVTSAAPALGLTSWSLTPGPYTISVYATDGTNTSNTASKAVTLVEADLNSVQIYPNPWRSDKHAGKNITFANLPLQSTVKIFTVSGHLAKTLSTQNTGLMTWDLSTDSGDKVASGIYLYLIMDGEGNKVHGKLAVIR